VNIKRSKVDKILIMGNRCQDNVNVYLEDFGLGQGRIVIERTGDSWAYYWGSMGDRTLMQFFTEADDSYLVGKLTNERSTRQISDVDALREWAKKEIIELRQCQQINRLQARLLWDDAEQMEYDGLEANQDLLHKIVGPDWYEYVPQEPNPIYDDALDIVRTVKQAFMQLLGEEASLLTKAKFNEAIKSLEEHHG
jgi:hypothetical protein